MVDLVKGDTRLIIGVCRKHGLLRNQAAYVLATAYWETNRTMKPVKEACWLSEDWRRKNLRYYPWYGRGYVQITWEENYKRYAITDPDDALKPDVAAHILVDGMKHGKFRGKKLSDYITLQKSDFKGARDIINGDQSRVVDGERIDDKLARFAREYDALLKAEGYGEESTTPAPSISKPPTSKTDLPATTQKNTSKGGLIGLIIAAIAAAATIFFGITGD